jgi:hypothetical protein
MPTAFDACRDCHFRLSLFRRAQRLIRTLKGTAAPQSD